MPELPDLTVYLDFLQSHIVGQTLERVRVASPFVLRTADPPLKAAENKRVLGLRRSGKRLILELEDDLFLMIHLMIAGRFRWKEHGAAITGKIGLAAFDFTNGTLLLTEASQKKRAAIHLLRGADALADFDRGGLEPLDADLDQFRSRLLVGNHTIKRALTDPDLFSGIGNAYSDEILHRAKISPVKLTHAMNEGEVERVFSATREVLEEWIQRLRDEAKGGFPEKVTSPARSAAHQSSASSTPKTNPTTARHARPVADCWRIERSRGYSSRTGRAPSKSSRRANRVRVRPHRRPPRHVDNSYRLQRKGPRTSRIRSGWVACTGWPMPSSRTWVTRFRSRRHSERQMLSRVTAPRHN
jgi:formamidopyrimidine-DNA glycosylase